jgi:tripartite-type tricarboxylate transporter receptor subunit TctC
LLKSGAAAPPHTSRRARSIDSLAAGSDDVLHHPGGQKPMPSRRSLIATAAAALLATLAVTPAAAQKYPERPMTMLVPWAAGGGADAVARIFAANLERALGQPVNVVNRTGGGGVAGHSAIQNAAPDGYTFGLATSEIATYKAMGLADISPDSFDLISRVTTLPSGLTVKADGPYKTAADLIAALKAAPKGSMTSSGTGPGGAWHLAVAGLSKAIGLSADHLKYIPSQGGAPALQDLAAGGLNMTGTSPLEAKALSDGGKVKVLAVMDGKRNASFPDVPTLKEATGLDWQFVNWFALVLPKGVPADIRKTFVEIAQKTHASPDVQKALSERGFTPVWESSDDSKKFAGQFSTMANDILKDLGLTK